MTKKKHGPHGPNCNCHDTTHHNAELMERMIMISASTDNPVVAMIEAAAAITAACFDDAALAREAAVRTIRSEQEWIDKNPLMRKQVRDLIQSGKGVWAAQTAFSPRDRYLVASALGAGPAQSCDALLRAATLRNHAYPTKHDLVEVFDDLLDVYATDPGQCDLVLSFLQAVHEHMGLL